MWKYTEFYMNILNKVKEKIIKITNWIYYIPKRNTLSFNIDFNLIIIIQDVCVCIRN